MYDTFLEYQAIAAGKSLGAALSKLRAATEDENNPN